jgi:cysteine-S-conjugate beta-lyase
MIYNFDEIIERNGTNSLKYDGKERYFGKQDLIPLWVADMDFRTPDFIIDALKMRLQHEILGYTLKTDHFFNALVKWVDRRFNWQIQKEWISFTPGVVSALNFGVLSFTKPGDKVIIQTPVYHPFFTAISDHDRQITINELIYNDGQYSMDYDGLRSLIDNKTKLLILCNPHNPVGRVWKKEELMTLANICLEKGVTIISDEIHSDLILPGSKHIPIASLSDEIAAITVTLMAPSKTFNIAGLASSAAISSNPDLKRNFEKIPNSMHISSGNLFGLTAFEAAYTLGDIWLQELLHYLDKNLIFIKEFFRVNIPSVQVVNTEGTYLAWLNFKKLGMTDNELRTFLINNAKVGLNSGTDFGPGGEGFMRINFGCPKQVLEEGLKKIHAAILQK